MLGAASDGRESCDRQLKSSPCFRKSLADSLLGSGLDARLKAMRASPIEQEGGRYYSVAFADLHLAESLKEIPGELARVVVGPEVYEKHPQLWHGPNHVHRTAVFSRSSGALKSRLFKDSNVP